MACASDLAFDSSQSWGYNNGTHYDTGTRNWGSLVSPWIDLTNVSIVSLRFRSWHVTEDTGLVWDRKIVSVLTDGTNWTQVFRVSGTAGIWKQESVDLSSFAGRRIKIRFYFDTMDALYNAYRGWYVDNIDVVGITGSPETIFADDMEGTTNWAGSGVLASFHTASRQWTVALGLQQRHKLQYGGAK